MFSCGLMIGSTSPTPAYQSDKMTIQLCVEICRGLEMKVALINVMYIYILFHSDSEKSHKNLQVPNYFLLNIKNIFTDRKLYFGEGRAFFSFIQRTIFMLYRPDYE